MGLRRDALAAAAETIQAIETEAAQTGTTVGTVGQLRLMPGGINIIPGRVECSLDLRDVSEEVRDRVESRILKRARDLQRNRGVGLEVETLQRVAPAPCSELVQKAAEAACKELGLESFSLVSGAGHDGMQLAELCPMAMILIRSRGGISHNPSEWCSQEDCTAGCSVLYCPVLDLAGGRV